ncbi:MAG: transposase [Sphingobacteriales bacterium]|nr:transposase [Sphingobacteriales bacterium]
MKLAAADIWRPYQERSDAESRIKELKYDFGFDSFNLQSFFGTGSALTFAIIAYNLMAFLEHYATRKKTENIIKPKLKNLCSRCLF